MVSHTALNDVPWHASSNPASGCEPVSSPGPRIQRLNGGDGRNRTGDILLARQTLSQLSYVPEMSGRRHAAGQHRIAGFPTIAPKGRVAMLATSTEPRA